MKIQHRLSPLFSRVRPRFGLTNRYSETAARSWEIAPSTDAEALPGIYDPADLEKIKGVYPGNTFDVEWERIPGRTVRHGPTVAYEFRDAVLARGHMFTRRASLSVGTAQPPWFAKAAPEIDHAVLASTRLGVRYFGHWLHDDLSLLLAAQQLGKAVSVNDILSPAQVDYLAALSLQPTIMTEGLFRKLVVIDDAGLNAYRKERYMQLRRVAASHATPSNSPGVMLLRGTGGLLRRLVNEDEVADMARRRGFLVLDPLRASVTELLDACTGTPIILGVEGSHLSNGIMWMAERGAVVTLQPAHRFTTVLKNWCDMVGTRYAFKIGESRDADSFHVNVDEVERLLDKTLSAVC